MADIAGNGTDPRHRGWIVHSGRPDHAESRERVDLTTVAARHHRCGLEFLEWVLLPNPDGDMVGGRFAEEFSNTTCSSNASNTGLTVVSNSAPSGSD